MRLTRRGMFAQDMASGFVWAVYSLKYGADESTAPYTGSFTLSSASYYKMAAKEYTATTTTFTLTNPVQTTRANLQVGDYLVNISTSSNTATSGSYLYKITGISGNTFSYTRWSPVQVKNTYLYDVSAQEQIYPVNGMQGGYWYVMVKGEYVVYVWSVYNVTFTYGWSEYFDGYAGRYVQGTTLYYGSSYTFDKATGNYTIVNPTAISYSAATANIAILAGKYFTVNAPTDTTMYRDPSGISGSTFLNLGLYTRVQDTTYIVSASRGTATGTEAEAYTRDAYPDNSYTGNLWYVYSHSYIYKI